MDELTLSANTDYFHGNIVYNSATNEIKIYDSDKNEFVKINIDTDSSKKPIGIKLNNIPIDLNHLNTVSKKNLEDTELYYKTGPDDLKNLSIMVFDWNCAFAGLNIPNSKITIRRSFRAFINLLFE